MLTVQYASWSSFRKFVLDYSVQDRERRRQLAFRGHADYGFIDEQDRPD